MKNTNIEALNKELYNEVTVKIVSSMGHDEWTEAPNSALGRIQDQCDNHSKWAYLDGMQVNPGGLTVDDLLNAEDITLTNALVGG
jgi:hypothetical protein